MDNPFFWILRELPVSCSVIGTESHLLTRMYIPSWIRIHQGLIHSGGQAQILWCYLCSVNTPIHNSRFLFAFAPARPVWIGPKLEFCPMSLNASVPLLVSFWASCFLWRGGDRYVWQWRNIHVPSSSRIHLSRIVYLSSASSNCIRRSRSNHRIYKRKNSRTLECVWTVLFSTTYIPSLSRVCLLLHCVNFASESLKSNNYMCLQPKGTVGPWCVFLLCEQFYPNKRSLPFAAPLCEFGLRKLSDSQNLNFSHWGQVLILSLHVCLIFSHLFFVLWEPGCVQHWFPIGSFETCGQHITHRMQKPGWRRSARS